TGEDSPLRTDAPPRGAFVSSRRFDPETARPDPGCARGRRPARRGPDGRRLRRRNQPAFGPRGARSHAYGSRYDAVRLGPGACRVADLEPPTRRALRRALGNPRNQASPPGLSPVVREVGMAQDRAEEYRKQADECRLQAKKAKRKGDKAKWLKMAD